MKGSKAKKGTKSKKADPVPTNNKRNTNNNINNNDNNNNNNNTINNDSNNNNNNNDIRYVHLLAEDEDVSPHQLVADTEEAIDPLYLASQDGRLEVVKRLLASGASVDTANEQGATPLYIAACRGHAEVASTLIAAGANVKHACADGSTPLYSAAYLGHLEVVQILIAKGTKLDASASNGSTPLHVAAQEGHATVVKALLVAGSAVDTQSPSSGSTALFMAARDGHLDSVNALLAHGANVELANLKGLRPLHAAVLGGFTDVVSALVNAGADIMAPPPEDVGDSSALDAAKSQRNKGIIAILEKAKPLQQRLKEHESKLSTSIKRKHTLQRFASIHAMYAKWTEQQTSFEDIHAARDKSARVQVRLSALNPQAAIQATRDAENAVLADSSAAIVAARQRQRTACVQVLSDAIGLLLEQCDALDREATLLVPLCAKQEEETGKATTATGDVDVRELYRELMDLREKCVKAFNDLEQSHHQSIAVMSTKTRLMLIGAHSKVRTRHERRHPLSCKDYWCDWMSTLGKLSLQWRPSKTHAVQS
jgi:ankyrin repeat protein